MTSKVDKVNILGVLVDKVDMKTAVAKIEEFINQQENKLVVTPGAEVIVQAWENDRLREIINSAALVVPDGAGVVWASKILGQPLKERVAGIDLVKRLLACGEEQGYKFYFLGGKPGVAKQAKREVKERYPNLIIYTHHGYLTRKLERKVITEIRAQPVDILLVGMGVPLQEKWLAAYLSKVDVPVGIGVGGTFDVLAKEKDRAPKFMQKSGLEWL
jgi:N-acetylglucosaminyldiphosphoundecaprenol N-acetyl-beta-D-mannosaminyltransferase